MTGFEGSAFKGTSITSVTINAKLTSIGFYAFMDCTSLTSIKLPETLTSIGNCAFDGCNQLKFPELPKNLQSIKYRAFAGCTSLGEITYPVEVSLDGYVFAASKITAIHWPEYDGEISIPDGCFSGLTGIDEITLPKYVKDIDVFAFKGAKIRKFDLSIMAVKGSIGARAFEGSSVSEIIFPKQLSSIGVYAFYNCRNLQKVTLPEGLTQIPNYCFYYCQSLNEVIVPDCVTTIGESAFAFCKELVTFKMSASLVTIKDNAFENCSISSIDLPATLITIGKHAFSNCSKITAITLPDKLQTIGNAAFSSCRLQEISIPASVISMGNQCFSSNKLEKIEFAERTDVPEIGSGIFLSNETLESFTFPDWMTAVPKSIFSGCENLSSLENFKPTTIGERAFDDCLRLKIGSLPLTLTSIAISAFHRCGESLPESEYFIDELVISGDVSIADNAFEAAKIKSLVVNADDEYFGDVTNFGANVLANVKTISSVKFPDDMTRIPDGFCKGWENLTEVIWPSKVTALGISAFEGCSKFITGEFDFNSVFPWNQITEYGDYSLSNTSISSVKWPESGSEMTFGKGLFANNAKLSAAVIPGWMHEIPDELYHSCKGVTDLIWEQRIDDEPITIGSKAFSYLDSLKEITLPDVDVNIGTSAFEYCTNAMFSWPEKKISLSPSSFSSCRSIEFEKFPEYIESIPERCFSGCSGLKKLDIGEHIADIGPYAFYSCDNLEETHIHSNISEVPINLFENCFSLKTVTFDHNIERIKREAFRSCRKLTDIRFSTDQQAFAEIGYQAFGVCESLPIFIEHIDNNTAFTTYGGWYDNFSYCKSLKALSMPATAILGEVVNHDINLQAINFKSKGRFSLSKLTVPEVPLLGVSTQPVKLSQTPSEITTTERAKKGVMMVARGDRWRYEEAGYNKIWDIREYRPAETAISGTIHSQFKEGDTRNQYTSYLSWEVNLCDLNPDGETTYTLWRRGNTDVDPTKVATLHIEQPHTVETGVNDLNVVTSDPLIVAKIQVESPDGTMKDMESIHTDFDFLTGEDLYEMKSSNQHGSLYFNPSTTRRVGVSEAMGTESRLLFIDRFASPDLNGEEGPVPDYYEYYVTAASFEYDEPVNNDNYDVDPATGLAYHLEHRTRPGFTSEVCRVYTPMALPSLQFNGIYSTEEVMADTDGTLRDSNLYNDRGEIKLNYSYHPDVIRHRETENSTTKYVVQNITCYQIDNDTKDRLLSQTVNHDSPNGTVTTREIKPNTTFQMVTETFARGTFGSRAVHVYGAPTLRLSAGAFQLLGWDGHNHPEGAISSKLQLIPDVSQMGYTGDKLTLNAANHRFGLWRTTTVTAPETPLMTAADGEGAPSEVLVNHFDGPVEENFTNSCETCAALRGYNPETLSYTDIIAAAPDYGGKVHADYRGRLYVQLADDPYHWMVAEARATPPYEHTNRIDDIPSEIPGDAIFYDLQGRRVVNPAHGEILIMVTSRGSYKIRY